jgi:hypothetical protein
MTDSGERPRVLSKASRSILSSNRRIVTCKSSACSFSAATIYQPGRQGGGHGLYQGYPANHQPEGHEASRRSDRVVIAVSDRGHRGLVTTWAGDNLR